MDPVRARLRAMLTRAGLADPDPAVVTATLCVAVLVCALALWRWWPRAERAASFEAGDGRTVAEVPRAVEPSVPASLVVHVVGSVRHPGVYRVPQGTRVGDAVDAAGGLMPDAAADAVNLARPVADGEQIAVPSLDDATSMPPGTAGVPAPAGAGTPAKVDINSADATQLDALPGIGPSTAAKIVSDREANGPYASVEDLGRVSGIGDKRIAALKDLIRVR